MKSKRQPGLSSKDQWELAARKTAVVYGTFVELWPSMTQEDLKKLIERRPELWSRFSGYLKDER